MVLKKKVNPTSEIASKNGQIAAFCDFLGGLVFCRIAVAVVVVRWIATSDAGSAPKRRTATFRGQNDRGFPIRRDSTPVRRPRVCVVLCSTFQSGG